MYPADLVCGSVPWATNREWMMARKSKTNARKKQQAAQVESETPKGFTRRGLLRGFGFSALGVLALGGAGYAGKGMVQQYSREHDLSQIGKEKPVVVQVHDPQCSICSALQRETRKALKDLGEGDMVYVIADITQTAGQVFSRRHNVPHVTLVLFDGQGEAMEVLSGMRQRADLLKVFKAHFAKHGA